MEEKMDNAKLQMLKETAKNIGIEITGLKRQDLIDNICSNKNVYKMFISCI